MSEGLQAGRKLHELEMNYKHMDVLEHSLKSLHVAKHKDWSEYGMSEHRDHNERLQAAQDISIYSSSASIHCPSQSATHSQPRYSELQTSSFFQLFDSAPPRYHRLAQPTSNMVEYAKLDTKALIAAALAPVPGFPNLGQTSDNDHGSKGPANTDIPAEKVSPNVVVKSCCLTLRITEGHQLTAILAANNKWISQTSQTYIKCLFTVS
jgi:hypothetical protein